MLHSGAHSLECSESFSSSPHFLSLSLCDLSRLLFNNRARIFLIPDSLSFSSRLLLLCTASFFYCQFWRLSAACSSLLFFSHSLIHFVPSRSLNSSLAVTNINYIQVTHWLGEIWGVVGGGERNTGEITKPSTATKRFTLGFTHFCTVLPLILFGFISVFHYFLAQFFGSFFLYFEIAASSAPFGRHFYPLLLFSDV